ncbi:MAG TPA: hypothetical protein VJ716_06220 [Gaiellaceae bacterium]|nr:hypothetical protein [Gaiellaceae bacterium]
MQLESAGASVRTEARRAFDAVLTEFERTEVEQANVVRGRLADHYWCRHQASGVALAEIRKHEDVLPPARRLLKWLRLWHPFPEYRIYRQTDWVTVEYPQLAALLHDCDVLEVKAHWGLEGIYQAVVLPWLMAVEKHVLGFIESEYRRQPPRVPKEAEKTQRDFCREIRKELSRIEDYYQRAGEKQGRLHYLAGMVLFGVGIVALAGVASAFALAAFDLLDLHSGGVRRFYACMAAGAVGAIVSVLIRMGGHRGGFNIDHELGSAGVRRLGAMRPLIGAFSGVAVSLIVQTTLVPIQHRALTFEFYVVVAFLAGFSERWTKVVLDGAMRTIEKVDDDQKSRQPSRKGAASQGT